MRISTFFIPLAYPSPYEVPLNLLQGPALSLRYLAPEVRSRRSTDIDLDGQWITVDPGKREWPYKL
jgi:hypothetical protein